ncbi:DNA-binding barrel domain superfamily [Sesbania bispinosa]|nr:DNA-binding barrel domain superfamily [Sesbania bispinosa]
MAEESSDDRKGKRVVDEGGNNDWSSSSPSSLSSGNYDTDAEEQLVADILLKMGDLMLESLTQLQEGNTSNSGSGGSPSQQLNVTFCSCGCGGSPSKQVNEASKKKKERQLLLVPPVPSLKGIVKDGKFSKPFEKRLEANDASNLFLPKREIEDCFLEFLKEEDGGGVLAGNGVQVMVYDKDGKGHSMMLKRRDNRGYRMLNGKGGTGWGSFYETHDLVFEDFITVWAFRHAETHMLCFVVISGKVDLETE